MTKRPAVSANKLLIAVCLSALSLFVWWAVWFMASGSLMSLEELNYTLGPVFGSAEGYAYWPIIPSWPTLQPIAELLLDTPVFFAMYWNSFKLVIPSVAGQLIIGAPAAWALSRLKLKRKKLLTAVYIILMLMPFQVAMVPNYLVISKLGIMDTIWAIILPFAFSAFPVFIMMKGFDSVPASLIEAAAIDGASHFRIFVSIGLPLGLPGILSALVLGFLECWNAIEQPMAFLNDSSKWPLSLYLPQIVAEKLGLAMASSLMVLVPAVLVFLFGQKHLELGIQATGVKE